MSQDGKADKTAADDVQKAPSREEEIVNRIAEDIHTTAADFDPFHVDGEAHAAHEPEAIVDRIADDIHTTPEDFNPFADH